jgi:hypothetical protein
LNASGALSAIDYVFSAELAISAFCETKQCYLDSQKGLTVTKLLGPSSMTVALLVGLLFLGTTPRIVNAAKSPVKVQNANGTLDPATGEFRLEGVASHLGRFTALGEIELVPGEEEGSLIGQGVVVFTAANGDQLVGIMTWDLEGTHKGGIHFSWRDSVEFADGTVVTNTGRFVDDRPPGALIALEWIFVATILILAI